MRNIFAPLICLPLSQFATTASAQEFSENWSVSSRQGYQEHLLGNGPGNSFSISCDIGAASAGEPKRTRIFISILGKPPLPQSFVDIFVIDELFKMGVDEGGVINTDCNVCAGNFVALWNKLRKSSAIVVQFSDGRASKFKTAGAAKALSPKPCATGIAR